MGLVLGKSAVRFELLLLATRVLAILLLCLLFHSPAMADATSRVAVVPILNDDNLETAPAVSKLYSLMLRSITGEKTPDLIDIRKSVAEANSYVQTQIRRTKIQTPVHYSKVGEFDRVLTEHFDSIGSNDLRIAREIIAEQYKLKERAFLLNYRSFQTTVLSHHAITETLSAAEKLGIKSISSNSPEIKDFLIALDKLGRGQAFAAANLSGHLVAETPILGALGIDDSIDNSALEMATEFAKLHTRPNFDEMVVQITPELPNSIMLSALLSLRVYSEDGSHPKLLFVTDPKDGAHGVAAKDGFGAAAYSLDGRSLYVVYRGTEPDDLDDFSADLQLGIDFLLSKNNVAGLATDTQLSPDGSKLDSQILQAKEFYRHAANAFSRKYGFAPESTTVTGHSLAGVLATIVGVSNNVRTRTYASTGLPSLTARRHGVVIRSTMDIVNVGRGTDIVYNIGAHVGQNLAIDGVPALDGLPSNALIGVMQLLYDQHSIQGISDQIQSGTSGVFTTNYGAEQLRAEAAVAQPSKSSTREIFQEALGQSLDTDEQAEDSIEVAEGPNWAPSGHGIAYAKYDEDTGGISSTKLYMGYVNEETGEEVYSTGDPNDGAPVLKREELPDGEQRDSDLAENDDDANEDDDGSDGEEQDGVIPKPEDEGKCVDSLCLSLLAQALDQWASFETKQLSVQKPSSQCELDPACDPWEGAEPILRGAQNSLLFEDGCWRDPACDPPELSTTAKRLYVTGNSSMVVGNLCASLPACDPPKSLAVVVTMEIGQLVNGVNIPKLEVVFPNIPKSNIDIFSGITLGVATKPNLEFKSAGNIVGSGIGSLLQGGGEFVDENGNPATRYGCKEIQISDPVGYKKCREAFCIVDEMLLLLGLVEVEESYDDPNFELTIKRRFTVEELNRHLAYAATLDSNRAREAIGVLLIRLFDDFPPDQCLLRKLYDRSSHALEAHINRQKAQVCMRLVEGNLRSQVVIVSDTHLIVGSLQHVMSAMRKLDYTWETILPSVGLGSLNACPAKELSFLLSERINWSSSFDDS